MSDIGGSTSSGDDPLPSRLTRPDSRRRSAKRWLGLAVVVALVAAGGYGLTRDSQRDSDGDGLTDEIETAGWSIQSGSSYSTDPAVADTDRDGLTDGEEAGRRISPSQVVFAGFSDPLRPDSDGDGLGDADEADLSLDPLNPDEDGDHLTDGREVLVVGTDPVKADSDGDGFNDSYEDANRESQGLDPLAFDVQVSSRDYVVSFAKGMVAGDLWPEDSLAWLAGNVAAGASSSIPIPIVGAALGAIGDVRDAIAAAIHADWVGVGYSAVGALPGGDPLAVSAKVVKFLAHHPKLVVRAMAMIAKHAWIPSWIKAKVARYVYPRWEELTRSGVSEAGLLLLMQGLVDLDRLMDATRRPNYVSSAPTPFMNDGLAGEHFLATQLAAKAKSVRLQVGFSTRSCTSGCNAMIRRIDVYADGIAHESKVGSVVLSKSVEAQIRSDAWLVKTGAIRGAVWDFFASGYTKKLGPNDKVLDLLQQLNIPFRIHWPEPT